MYLILEIKPYLNVNQINSDSIIINSDTSSNISFALNQLENSAKDFIKEEFGNSVVNNVKLEEIDNVSNLDEQSINPSKLESDKVGVYLYKTKTDNTTLYVYQKREKNIPGYVWGSSSIYYLDCIRIFVIKEYTCSKTEKNDVEFITINKMNIPKPVTVSPFSDLIRSLKESEKFIKRKEVADKKTKCD